MGTSVHERKRQKERERETEMLKREDFHNRNIGFKG